MISKTTINMAARRGIAIVVNEDDNLISGTSVEFSKLIDGEAADEYDALYKLEDEGLFFLGSCFSNTEEWPYWIQSDKHLRLLLDDIAKELV